MKTGVIGEISLLRAGGFLQVNDRTVILYQFSTPDFTHLLPEEKTEILDERKD